MTLPRSPPLAAVLRLALRSHAAQLHVALPGRVESFDPEKCRASVKPLLQGAHVQEDGTDLAASLPVLPNVPVLFPGAGGFRVTFPIQVGDTVLLVFSDRALDGWLERGGEVDPQDGRKHHLTDAVAIPGLRPFVDAWTGLQADAMTLGAEGGAQVVITQDAVKLGGPTAAEAVALASKVAAELTALKSALNGWTPVPSDGGAALKVALSALFAAGWPSSVGSATVKAKD